MNCYAVHILGADIYLTAGLLVDLKARALWRSDLRAEISRCIVMLIQWHPEVPPPSSLCFLSSANSMQACLSVVIFVKIRLYATKKFFETFSYQFKILTWLA